MLKGFMPPISFMIFHNACNAKFVIGGFAVAHLFWWNFLTKRSVHHEVFGQAGNGGKMLKIITDLTDEEMARLKHVRRLAWHWRGSRQANYGRDTISDQELSDYGIQTAQEPYIEYAKRPPHDKYL